MSDINIIRDPTSITTQIIGDTKHLDKQRKAYAIGDNKVEQFINFQRSCNCGFILIALILFATIFLYRNIMR